MLGNTLYAQITIRGLRPLLWHAFGPEALPLERQERRGVPGNDPDEWRKTVLMTEERQLYMRPSYLFASLRDGARYTRKHRGTLQPYVAATLQMRDERILIDRYVPPEPIPTDPQAPVYLDIQSVKNPTTKARNVRYRIAAAAAWTAQFRVLWDRTILSREQFEAIAHDAGRLIGIGDGRTMGYGRFVVTAFEVHEALPAEQ